MRKGDVIGAIVLIVFLAAVLIYAGAVWDERSMATGAVDARIALLEKQMQDKIRPVIQINRATVYNTDGEIVIEGLD